MQEEEEEEVVMVVMVVVVYYVNFKQDTQILLLKTLCGPCSPPQFLITELARVQFEFEIRGVVVIVTRLHAGRPRIHRSIPGRVKIYYIFTTACILAQGSSQSPIQSVRKVPSPTPPTHLRRVVERVNDHSPPPSAQL